MNIIAEIRKINSPEQLTEILNAVKSQLQFAARFAYSPGSFVTVDFNTRGLHTGVVTKVGGKTVHVVLLGDQQFLPRNSRQWRVSPQILTPLPDAQKTDAQNRYDALKKAQPLLFR